MTWEDISIKQFNQINKALGSKKEPLDVYASLISITKGIPLQEVLDMPIHKFNACTKDLEFIKDKIEPRYPTTGKYTVNGKEYVMTPNANKMATGQYIDYTNTLRHDAQNIALLCAILMIPKGGKYGEGYDPLELAEEFDNHFKMVDAMGISFFFLKAYQCYTEVTLSSLTKKLKKEMKKEKNQDKVAELTNSIEQIQTAVKVIRQDGHGI